VTLEGISVDIMIEGQANMNRALDGDKVLLKLDPPAKWRLLENNKKNGATGANSKYSNKQVIEKRVVDEEPSEKTVDKA